MAGGADDRAHLEVHPLPRQTHLRTGPHTGQVGRNTRPISVQHAPFFICFFSIFLNPPHTLAQILRVIYQHSRSSISHLASHCAIPNMPAID